MGKCRNCACVKSGKHCSDCLPLKLGKCQNCGSHIAADTNPIVDTTPATGTSTMPELELRGPTPEAERAAPDEDDGPSPIGAHHVPEPQLFNIKWGELSGQELHDTINRIYGDVIHWSQNLFLVPLGATGSPFVKELARLFQAFADGGPMERISMKAITVFQILMLQKSSRSSRRRMMPSTYNDD